ncbi:single-stranded DNA-binding protein [Pediococcus pentosaceus]|uniref:single-stranded DNA-binding protein n=1 Tax=Pediococcus pentosaceus TaxID=1255 RepID=UPI001E325FE3|nr:single-stranded DNA-binding protein [Pediococcus pentosaceus]MCG7196540.1 single-stranded DNA-binding protein [Pediococcus pentosaceus]MCI2396212.1 single-stranded DNA-binding protein [Pediococcus pentosaceus]
MINRTVLVGRLTRDPELRYAGSGAAVATFTVAVNRIFTNSQGEREADFINCVMWNKTAENFCNFTRKGSLVGIDGRIQTRSYENQQGQRVYVTEVVAENFSLLESKNSNQIQKDGEHSNYQPQNSIPNQQNNQNDNLQPQNNSSNGQYGNYSNPNDPFSSAPQINDDDLPF